MSSAKFMNHFHFLLDIILCVIFVFLSAILPSRLIAFLFLLFYFHQIYYLLKEEIASKKFTLVSFNVFFLIMYSFVTYIIPLFFLFGSLDVIHTDVLYDEKYIIFSMFLSSIAIEFYIAGYLKHINDYFLPNSESFVYSLKAKKNILLLLAICGFCIFLFDYVNSYLNGFKDINGTTTTIINCSLIMPLVVIGYINKWEKYSLFKFIRKNGIIILIILFTVLALFFLGDRMTPLCLICSLVYVIDKFVYKISGKQFIIGIMSGFLVLFLISYTRNLDDGVNLTQGFSEYRQNENNKWIAFQDIIPINADLILGCELKDLNGLYKPMRIIPMLFYPVPFFPGYITNEFFDGDISTGAELTSYNIFHGGSQSGTGTHCVADIYMSWGLIGVTIAFYLLGLIIGKAKASENNLLGVLCYSAFISWSIYMPRETIFNPYRDIIWMIVLAFIIIGKSLKN